MEEDADTPRIAKRKRTEEGEDEGGENYDELADEEREEEESEEEEEVAAREGDEASGGSGDETDPDDGGTEEDVDTARIVGEPNYDEMLDGEEREEEENEEEEEVAARERGGEGAGESAHALNLQAAQARVARGEEPAEGGEVGGGGKAGGGGEEGDETQGEPEWRPQNEEELLDAIAEKDYGISDDRSSALTAPALKAYNNALKSKYGHYELKRGRTLPEGFVIVKVTADMACRVLCHPLP
jgi:hypothetical protein